MPTPTEPVRVLLVEDSADDALLLERALRRGGLEVEVERVETAEGMAEALERPVDVILADYNLPSFDAMEALELLKASGLDIPFVVVTGTIGEERAAELLRSGAQDFLLKGSLERLAPAVERELRDVEVRRERETARADLDRARARYEALVESASDVVYVVDPDGTVLFSSPSSEELVGVSARELLGSNAFRFVHPDDRERVREELGAVARGERRRAEYRIIRPDGEVRHVESVGTNLLDREAVAGIVVNTRDLTERKELEQQLLQAQKMEAIGRLAGGLAHDFNNLLTVISGNTRMLLEGLPEGTEEHDDAHQVLSAAERAAGLTRQLLAFSKSQVLNVRVVDVAEVVRGVQDMLSRLMSEDVRLTVAIPGEEVHARLDPVQLEQVLMNLAVNAREAMPQGGNVTVSVDACGPDDLHMEMEERPARQYARLVFRDTGPGIPQGVRGRIFEPFFSTKEMGTGLGLSTVYGIVAQSGGHIHVDCPPGGGTVFTLAFPLLEAPTEGPGLARSADEETPDGGRGERVLLVEDNADVRRVTHRILAREGFEVEEAETGDQALEILRGNGHVDLLITDLVMPGMPGAQLAREARALRPGVPVLYMSGYSGDEILGPDDIARDGAFLEKPFTPQELTGTVRRLLDQTPG